MRSGDKRPGFLAVLAALAMGGPPGMPNIDLTLFRRRVVTPSLKWASGLVVQKAECETCGQPLPAGNGGIRRYCDRDCRLRRHNKRGSLCVRRHAA